MQYATLISSVGQRAGTDDADEARRASEAVLNAFAGALANPERTRLADRLPGRLKPAVEEATDHHVADQAGLVRAVAERTGCTEERARYFVQAVLSSLHDTEPELMAEMSAQVPLAGGLMTPLGQDRRR